MINRSLIRIKTVQILYSYLLSRSDFRLEAAPEAGEGSRDQQIAYSVYLDMLVLLLKLSGVALRGGAAAGRRFDVPVALTKNLVGKALAEDSEVIALLARNTDRLAVWDSAMPEIMRTIENSAAYKAIAGKRKHELSEDVRFWITIFNTVIRKSHTVERVLRRDDNFSHLGFENGIDMLGRTLNSFDDSRATYRNAREALNRSLELAYDLYIGLLRLPVDITDLRDRQIDAAKHKYLPTHEDLNPNMRLVDNLLVEALRQNDRINDYIQEHPGANPLNWRDADLMVKRLLDSIMESDLYHNYMESESTPEEDGEFWREVMRTIVIPSDELAESLESTAIYWNDDIHIMGTFALKTMRRFYALPDNDDNETTDDTGHICVMPKFMNRQDEAFGAELFQYVVDNREKYRDIVDRFIDSKQWDSERLAFMDLVILMTALAEIINYPSIPAAVSLNEYIEIANDYSTPKSGVFINGILSSAIKMLREEGIISKQL